MLTKTDLKLEAKEYQNVSDICKEFKETLIEVSFDIIEFEKGQVYFHRYRDALVDLIGSMVNENYKCIIYSFDIEDKHEGIDITLNFVYDHCERMFSLRDCDFEDYKEFLEEEENEKQHN